MTVRELIEELQRLPKSTLDATVVIGQRDFDDDEETVSIVSVRYEYGEVVIESESDD